VSAYGHAQVVLDRLDPCAATDCSRKADGAVIGDRKFCATHGLALVRGERVEIKQTTIKLAVSA
jgi:hypothetical protein